MMKTNLLFKFVLSAFIILFITNCEIQEETTIQAEDYAKSVKLVSDKISAKAKTSDRLQGSWTSNQVGNKYKWTIEGDKLYKNIIFSFGEASEPQEYKITYLNGFDGKIDEAGNYISIQHVKSEKGIIYRIVKITNQYITLSSKFNEKIVLERL